MHIAGMAYRTTRNPMWVAAGVTWACVRSRVIDESSVPNSGVPPPSRTETTCTRTSSTGPAEVEHCAIVVGRRVEHPVVHHLCAVPERIIPAVVRAGDVPVERDGHVADHECHGKLPF